MIDRFDYDVFLCHCCEDKLAVRELAERLRADGLHVWFDEWVIKAGDSIPAAIEQGLVGSRTLILFMSRKAFASDWVALERHTTMFRDPTNQERRFVPLLLEDCEIVDTLRQFAYVDWRESDEEEYGKLLKRCQEKPDIGSDVKQMIADIVTGQSILQETSNLLDLVDTLGGCVAYALEGLEYSRFLEAFERIPADRYSLSRPGSSLRRNPMSIELGRLLYAGRGFSDSELEDYVRGVNERARLAQELLSLPATYACEEFFGEKDLKAFVNDNVFVRARQPLCEVVERINTITENLRDYARYKVFLFKEDARPFYDNFFLKECPVGDRRIRFLLKFGGSPDRDKFIIVSGETAHVEYGEIIRKLKGKACPLDRYPHGAMVFEINDAEEFSKWILANSEFSKVRASSCGDRDVCLKENALHCPNAECPAGNFSLIYNTIDDIATATWNAEAKHGRVLFSANLDVQKYGLTLVAGYPFDFDASPQVDALKKNLRERIGAGQVILFDDAYWHATIVAFRRSRSRPWESAECPEFEIVAKQSKFKPFTVDFDRIVFSKKGDIILCGILEPSAIKEVNNARNSLTFRRDVADGNGAFHRLRPGTELPKHRFAFHVTIGKLVGPFTIDRLAMLRRQKWIPESISANVTEICLLHYAQRNCFELLGEPVRFKLGRDEHCSGVVIRERLGIRQ